jgi:hypothetical protein
MIVTGKGPITADEVDRVLAQAKRMTVLKSVSIRYPVQDLEDAKAVAQQEGIGYQQVLKSATRIGLDAMLARHKRKPKRSGRRATLANRAAG